MNRREFLKKAGKYGAYTPPAIMMMMQPSMQAIAKSGGARSRPFPGESRRGGLLARIRAILKRILG